MLRGDIMETRGYRVFYLDLEEDINSLLSELGQTTAEKIALVLHQRSNIFYSRINIQLLEKYLRDWKKELVFISTEDRLIRLALESSILIYPDLDALENDEPITNINEPLVTSLDTEVLLPDVVASSTEDDEFYTPEPSTYRGQRPRKRWRGRIFAALFVILLLVGLGWVYFNFSIVTVEVTPTITKCEQKFNLIAIDNLDQINVSESRIPLETLGVTVNGSVKVATSGRSLIGYTRAEGVIHFINKKERSVHIPTGTVVKTGTGTQFKTTQEVTVPAIQVEKMGSINLGYRAGQAEANIVALEPGSQGNVSGDRIKHFLGKDYGVEVINIEATKGGRDREEMVVTQKDLDNAMSTLEEELKNQIVDELSRKLGNTYIRLKDTFHFELLEVGINHHVDEKAEELVAKGEMMATGYVLMKEDLSLISRELYMTGIPQYHSLYSKDIQLSLDQVTLQEDDKVQIQLTAAGFLRAEIQPTEIIETLKGQTVEYANNLLRKMEDIKYFEIFAEDKIRIPRFSFGIRVVVREPADLEEGSI